MNSSLDFSGAGFKLLLKVGCVGVVLLLAGCGALKNISNIDGPCESQPSVDGAANVSLFLNVQRQDSGPDLKLKISSIELLLDDLWVLVSSDLAEINSRETIHLQRFLGRQWLKGRSCRGVRVKVAGAVQQTRNGATRVLPVINPETVVMLQKPFALEGDSRKVLLLEWDPEKSLSAAGFEGMSLQAFLGGEARVTANLLYVACPELDTVFVVRIDSYQVVDAFAVKGNPSYLAGDPRNKKIHVLAPSLNKIISIDISTHLPGSEIRIASASSPLIMAVNNRTQTGYVLDDQGVVTSMDLLSGNMLRRNRVGNRPNYLYYLTEYEKLAVSSTIDQTVYLVNPDSLAVEEAISLGSPPLGLVRWGNYLYIAEGSANTVSVYDLNARKMLKNIQVGFGPTRFVAADNSVYVANFLGGSIFVTQGGQQSLNKEVRIGKSAREMAWAEKQRLLFVGEGDCAGSLTIVDTTGNVVIGRIELGAKPMGIVVVE